MHANRKILFAFIYLSSLELGSSALLAQTDATSKSESNVSSPSASPLPDQETKKDENAETDPQGAPTETEQSGMPVVVSHSELQATVYQGDKIILGVNAKGAKLLYRWVRNYKTICTGANCRFDSSRWGVGAQNITVVIYNGMGSQTLNFMVRVLARPIDQAYAEVEPKTVKAESTEALSAKDFFIKAVYGIGYSFKDRSDVRIVAQLPRAISWVESIKSHVQGLVQFGVRQKEEHLVLPGSSLVLSKSDELRRIISLRSGTLRSRQLALDAPSWSIVVDDWLQVDGDARADLVVTRKNSDAKKAIVTVLRGNARVLVRKGDNEEPQAFYLYAGIGQVFTPDTKSLNETLVSPKTLESIVRQSTPQYFLKKNESKGRITSFLADDISKKVTQAPGDAITEAKNALSEDDSFAALEALLPVYVANKQLYEMNIWLGHAYGRIGLFKEAFRYYKEAATLEPKNPEPPYQMGLLYVRSGNWGKAVESLEAARSLNHPNNQALEYQLGVSEFNRGQTYAARTHFRYAQWYPNNEEIRLSTESYLKGINDQRWFGAYGSLRIGKDSNVFRWGGGGRTDGYETESSMYYRGSLDMFVRAYDGEGGRMLFGFDIDKTVFTASGAKELNPLLQTLYMTWVLNMGVDATQRPVLQVDFEPYIRLLSLGDERSADEFGLNLKLASPRMVTAPYVRVAYATSSDPLPARDDKVDPTLREPVLPSDRSSKITGYGLGFDFVKESNKGINLELFSEKLEHVESLVKVDDYSELSLKFRTNSIGENRIGFLFDAGYLTRTFASSADSRKDTALSATLGLKYLFSSNVTSDICVDYLSQKSNRTISSYNRNDISLGLLVEL